MKTLLGVARYERIMLMRTTRYRLLGGIGIGIPIFMGVILAISNGRGFENGTAFGVSAFAPFYVYSFIQGLVIAFVAGDFRAADERACVHEVIAVRPPSTTQLVVGKYLGILQAMLALSLAVMIVNMAVQAAKLSILGTPFRVEPYLGFLLLMNLPGLVYMTALTFCLGALLRNRTAAALVALAYAFGTIFFLGERYGGVFDFGGFYAPLFYSDMLGFGELSRTIALRLLYMAAAVFLLGVSVERYPRLVQSGAWRWGGRLASLAALAVAISIGVMIQRQDAAAIDQRAQLLRAHATRADRPPGEIVHYDLQVRLLDGGVPLAVRAHMRVRNPGPEPLATAILTLNPGLEVTSVTDSDGGPLGVERDGSVVVVSLPAALGEGETAELVMEYRGYVDRNGFDLIRTAPRLERSDGTIRMPQLTAWIRPHSVYLPSRSGWYPASGVDYGHEELPKPSFATASIEVTAPAELDVITQGAPSEPVVSADGATRTTRFGVDRPVSMLTLNASNYVTFETRVGEVDVVLYVDPEHTAPVHFFDDAVEEVQLALRQLLGAIVRETGLPYPYPRLNVVEVPLVVQWYYEGWREVGGLTAPGVLMVEEDRLTDQNFERSLRFRRQRSDGELDEPAAKRDILVSTLFRHFLSPESDRYGIFRSPLVQLWSYDRGFVGEQSTLLERGMPVYLQQDVGSELRSMMLQVGGGRGGFSARARARAGRNSGDAALMAAAAAGRTQIQGFSGADWNAVLEAMQQQALVEMDPELDPELYRSVLDTKGISIFRMMKAVVGADVFVGAIENFAESSRYATVDFAQFEAAVQPVREQAPATRPMPDAGPGDDQVGPGQRFQRRPGGRRPLPEGAIPPPGGRRPGQRGAGATPEGQPPSGRRFPRAQPVAAPAPEPSPFDADLDRLVQEWLHGTAVPGYSITRATVEKLEDGRGAVVHQVVVRVRNGEPGLGFVQVNAVGFRDEVSKGVQIEGGAEVEVALVIADRPTRVTVDTFLSKNRRPLVAPLRVPDEVRPGSPESYVRRVTVEEQPFIEIIVDNEDEGFSLPTRRVQRYLRPEMQGGDWWVSSTVFAYGRYENNYRAKMPGDGAEPAVWSAVMPRSGEYDVAYYFLPSTSSGRRTGIWRISSRFELSIHHRGEVHELTLDTADLTGGWNLLGRYDFEEGEEVRVELSDRGDGPLYADAVRWRFADSDLVYEEDIAPWDVQQQRMRVPGARAEVRR